MKENAIYLVLENGKTFSGYSFGASGETVGEIAVTTSMVGYVETLTDPAFCGQIVVQTFPSIGNYGVIASDMESESPALHAYIVREWCQEPSNFRCEGDLDTFLKEKGVIGVYGIDTRELTRIVRSNGTMNAKITADISDLDAILAEIRSYTVHDAVSAVTIKQAKTFSPESAAVAKVAALDFGIKADQIAALTSRGCEVTVLPATTSADHISGLGVDGIFLSGGPGNPADNISIIEEIQKLLTTEKPMLGIGLGHQMLAIAHGAKTVKMPYGHRGGSQPTAEVGTTRIHNTSQNCGYTVDEQTLPSDARVTYRNINDGVCEGVAYDDNTFSVQFYPSRNTEGVYDKFVNMMIGGE